MTDAESSRLHYDRVAKLANALATRGYSIYEHHYLLLGFGSFHVEIGKHDRRWGFSWDGRDGLLTASDPYQPIDGKAMPPVIGHVEHLGLDNPGRPYAYILGCDFDD